MRRTAYGLAAIAAAVLAVVVVWRLRQDGGGDAPRPDLTTEERRAVEAAWAALLPHYDVGDKWFVEVERDDDVFVVTWPLRAGPPRPTGDFRARVKVNARTYEVIAIAVGS